jgi:hypothetical protein
MHTYMQIRINIQSILIVKTVIVMVILHFLMERQYMGDYIHSLMLLSGPFKCCSQEIYLLPLQKYIFKVYPEVKCQGTYITNPRWYKRDKVLEDNRFRCGKQAFRDLGDASLTSVFFSALFTPILLKRPAVGLLIFQHLTVAFSSLIPTQLIKVIEYHFFWL